MRRGNLGPPTDQYYPVMIPSVDRIDRVEISMSLRFPGLGGVMAKRDIAPSFIFSQLRPSLSLFMCAEIPGHRIGAHSDSALLYLPIPFDWGG